MWLAKQVLFSFCPQFQGPFPPPRTLPPRSFSLRVTTFAAVVAAMPCEPIVPSSPCAEMGSRQRKVARGVGPGLASPCEGGCTHRGLLLLPRLPSLAASVPSRGAIPRP